ncbi:hypothetical protein BGW39_004067, partial [Mortierella sp. 14UC]
MTNKRTQFDTSIKSIPNSQPNRSTASLRRQSSFHGMNDPAAAPIRSPSPTAPNQEHDPVSENEEANTTFTQIAIVDLDSDDDEKPPVTSQGHVTDHPAQEDPFGSTQAVQVGQFLARLEIHWHETISELMA